MKIYIFFGIIAILLICAGSLSAGNDFTWLPITEDDWNIGQDESKNILNAVMIFEKIEADDKDMFDKKCYYTIYRRIRILNEEGRSWGDVTVPFLHKDQKIEDIQGRTVLQDGNIIPLNKSQILDKDLIKSKEVKIKQKYFYLPAVTSNCIIEYYIKFKLKRPNNIWVMSKDIYLMKGELVWKFYRGADLDNSTYSILSDYLTPNYIWLNSPKPLTVEQRPSLKDPHEVVFNIEDIPASEDEPYSLPDNALKANLRFYYGGSNAPDAFWGDLAKRREKRMQTFTKEDKRLKDIVKDLNTGTDPQDKIEAAYEWVQHNLKNIDYEYGPEEYKDNENVNDVLKNGYGSGEDINAVFYDLLREMNVDVKVAYVTDRDEDLFEKLAKYWQFDRSIVVLKDPLSGKFSYYCPAIKFLPSGSLPWYNQGVIGFLIGDLTQQFFNTEISYPEFNRIKRHINLKLHTDNSFSGTVFEIHRGQSAQTIRLNLWDENERERNNYLKNRIKSELSGFEPDSFEISNPEDIEKSLNLKYTVKVHAPWYESTNRKLLKPFDFCCDQKINFYADERKSPVILDYPRQVIETVAIDLPEGWIPESVPDPMKYSCNQGSFETTFNLLNNNRTISAQRLMSIDFVFFKTSEYPAVADFFKKLNLTEKQVIVLKKQQAD